MCVFERDDTKRNERERERERECVYKTQSSRADYSPNFCQLKLVASQQKLVCKVRAEVDVLHMKNGCVCVCVRESACVLERVCVRACDEN